VQKFLEGKFYNPTKGNMDAGEVIREIIDYIFEKPEMAYDIIIGCDSSSSETPDFPLVVVVLRPGLGGRFFVRKIFYENRMFYQWKQRILEEVTLSCEFALWLKENFEKEFILALDNNKKKLSVTPHYQMCHIHADIGEKGKTSDMIKEIVGMIKGIGFMPKIKPESFAASSIADRYS
jgi:uncharacterized protein